MDLRESASPKMRAVSWIWLIDRIHDANRMDRLQTVYRIDGSKDLTDTVLTHLDGYRQSRPVRIGNDAYKQLQLDIYGELMDALYLYNKYGNPISYDLWVGLRRLINWLCDNWQPKDDGVWEVRSGRAAFPLFESDVLGGTGSGAAPGRQTVFSRGP